MNQQDNFEKLGNLFNLKKTNKVPAYQWQDFALSIIKDLGVPANKRSSIFKVCKDKPKSFIQLCLNDTKELCNTVEKWKYFFKLVNKK